MAAGEGDPRKTVLGRLNAVERNSVDLSKSITEVILNVQHMEARVSALELLDREREKREIRSEEQYKALQLTISEIKQDVGEILGAGRKLLWIVVGSVTLAFLGFLLKGGLGT